MQPRASISALDDSSLLEILTLVGAADARDLAKCRCVSKRWREVTWIVPCLTFRFSEMGSNGFREKESVLSNVLRDTRRAAPRCLETLKVTLICIELQSEVTGHWLVHVADSVVDLDLELAIGHDICEPLWGPAVWTSLWGFKALKRLKIAGGFFSRQLLPVVNELPFKNLTSCYTYATSKLISALCAACPVLKHLSITEFQDDDPVEVSSASLESFVLCPYYYACWGVDTLPVYVRTPRLASLHIGSFRYDGVELRITSQTAKSLSRLHLGGPCIVHCEEQCDKISRLHVDGMWVGDALVDLLKLTPVVTDLVIGTLRVKNVMHMTMPIGQVFRCLSNLKTVCFHSLEAFRADDVVLDLETVAVRVEITKSCQLQDHDQHILKHLLDVYGVGVLVAHTYSNNPHSSWQAMMDAYPSRVILKY